MIIEAENKNEIDKFINYIMGITSNPMYEPNQLERLKGLLSSSTV